MERRKKEDQKNKKTSPTTIKGKDIDQANQTNSGAGGGPIKEGSNDPAKNAEKSKAEPQKKKEHQTQQDKERYKGANPDGMDTDLKKDDKKSK